MQDIFLISRCLHGPACVRGNTSERRPPAKGGGDSVRLTECARNLHRNVSRIARDSCECDEDPSKLVFFQRVVLLLAAFYHNMFIIMLAAPMMSNAPWPLSPPATRPRSK